jgi:hypothetical protein
MNLSQHKKIPHLFTLEIKGINFTMSKKELSFLRDLIIVFLKSIKHER